MEKNPVRILLLVVVALALSAIGSIADEAAPENGLSGLWEAKKTFGPEVRGNLTLERRGEAWLADIAGFSLEASTSGNVIGFELPGERGRFVGRFDAVAGVIDGHWIQPAPIQMGREVASPVHLEPHGPHRWRGEVVPRQSEYTFFLVIREREDGSLGTFLRNPDRNLGIIWNIDRVVRNGNDLEFMGSFFRSEDEQVLLAGRFHPDYDQLSVFLPPFRGGTYDFGKVGDDDANGFYARGKNPEPWVYKPPLAGDDGWSTASLADVGISVEPIAAMIEKEIDPPADNVSAPYVHAVLIARHGKLVLEEYFHRFHRDEPHDTRSASKSLTSLLTGATIQAGEIRDTSIPVYSTIFGKDLAEDLDPRKGRMTLEHLLTMTSGYYCDDRDYDAPGNEDIMQEQEEEPNWYSYTLALPMVSEPGETAVYCSVNSNLIGAVLTAATGTSLLELFAELIAKPLQMDRYYLNLQPTGEPYMGGGIHWLPREFMKLGQVILDGGVWNGTRIVSQEWATRSISALFDLRERKYGYLWWVIDYPYKDRTVRAFFAGGNGGQVVIGIPELDLLIAFFGGNYSDPVLYRSQDVLVPDYILKAVE